jgi:hypothetical protein
MLALAVDLPHLVPFAFECWERSHYGVPIKLQLSPCHGFVLLNCVAHWCASSLQLPCLCWIVEMLCCVRDVGLEKCGLFVMICNRQGQPPQAKFDLINIGK